MKQRNISGATLFNPRIYHQSYLNRATLQCDSRWERDYLIDCEFDKTITRFATQPISFTYKYDKKTCRFTSDILLQRIGGTFEHIEIKDYRYADCQTLRNKISHISSLLEKHQNSSLTLVTSKDIYDDPSHITRKILYKYMFVIVPDELTKMAISALYKSEMLIEDLEHRFIQKGGKRTDVWAFLAQHYSSIVFHGKPNLSSTNIINWSK